MTTAPVDGVSGVTLVVDSRCSAMRRELGPAAWVVLEELLSSAVVDVDLAVAVCRTSVRHLAKATALSKDTVSRSLNRLRGSRLLRFEREQHDDSGRFVNGVLGAVYVELGEPGKNDRNPESYSGSSGSQL